MKCRNCNGVRGFFCHDCGKTHDLRIDGYMVREELWAKYGCDVCHNHEAKPWLNVKDNRRGFLCLDCLAARMKRPIQRSDFQVGVPINKKHLS